MALGIKGLGSPGPPLSGLRSASSSSRRGCGLLVVDHDRGAGPGVAQVAGVGLARAEVRLVDPGAGVPVAIAAVAARSGRRPAAGGCGRRRSAAASRPSRGCGRPGRRPRARARRGRCARPRSAPGRAAARRPGRQRLLAGLARGLVADDGVEVGLAGERLEAVGLALPRSRSFAARRSAPRTGAPSAWAKRPARWAARKTFCWAWVPCGIWAAM